MRKKVTLAVAGCLILGVLSTTPAQATPVAVPLDVAPLQTLGDHVPHTVVVKYRDAATAPLRGALERLVAEWPTT